MVAQLKLRLRRIGIDTHRECIAFLDDNGMTSRALGLHPMDRIMVSANGRSVLAVLNIVEGTIVPHGTIGLSNTAFARLGAGDDTLVDVRPADPPASMDMLRVKMAGRELSSADYGYIVDDIVQGRFSKIELTAFVVSAMIFGLTDDEVIGFTNAMIETGDQLRFDSKVVADKHCIGGVPGNRTTPIVTSIVAAAGLVIPKTSSRSVTSPAGTADTMEVLMDVELPAARIYEVVREENGCLSQAAHLTLQIFS